MGKAMKSLADSKLGSGNDQLSGSLAKKGAKNPDALAAFIGRKSKKFNGLKGE